MAFKLGIVNLEFILDSVYVTASIDGLPTILNGEAYTYIALTRMAKLTFVMTFGLLAGFVLLLVVLVSMRGPGF